MSKLRNNPEFMQQLEEDGKSLDQYTDEFFLKYPMEIDGPDSAIIVLSSANEARALEDKYNRAKSLASDPLDVAEFAGAEAEITQDEINQYIADNQWRLDFGDVRRMSSDSIANLFEPSPELKALESKAREQKDKVSQAQALVSYPISALTVDQLRERLLSRRPQYTDDQLRERLDALDPQILNEPEHLSSWWSLNVEPVSSEWGSRGVERLDQRNSARFDQSLLDRVLEDPLAYFYEKDSFIEFHVFRPINGKDGGASVTGTDLYQGLEQSGAPLPLLLDHHKLHALGPRLKNWRSKIQTDPKLGESRTIIADASSPWPIRDEYQEVHDRLKPYYESLGGYRRKQQLVKQIRDWIISKDQKTQGFFSDLQAWENSSAARSDRGPKPRLKPSEMPQAASEYDSLNPERFEQLMSAWAKSDSIYGEQMPDRQKQIFMREYQQVLELQRELSLIRNTWTMVTAANDAMRAIDDMRTFAKVEYGGTSSTPVEQLRQAQADYEKMSEEIKDKREKESSEASIEQNVDFTISDRDPQLDSYSLLGGKEVNKRQILIIDPSPEMRDYKAELQVAKEIEQQPGAEMEFEGVDYVGQSGHPQHLIALFKLLYHADHWHGRKERGTGVHIRVHDMTVMRDGKPIKILVVEEIQNDHAQKNRKVGSKLSDLRSYILMNRISDINVRRLEIIDLSNSAENPNAVNGNLVLVPGKEFEVRTSQRQIKTIAPRQQLIDPALKDEYVALTREVAKLQGQWDISDQASEPQAVFQNTEEWTQLAMRKVFKIALEEGYGGVAVIGGRSAGPITMMPTVEVNFQKLKKQIDSLEDTDSFEVDGLLSKTFDPVWNETGWSGVFSDIQYSPRFADFSVNLNIDKLNETIGLYDFLQEHKKESEYISGAKLKEFIQEQDPYIGSSAQKHYDENVAKQGKIITGVEGVSAVDENMLHTADGKPVIKFKSKEDKDARNRPRTLLRGGSGGAQAYLNSPPQLWVFDEKMVDRLSGPQPLISPELKEVKGGWDRPLSELYEEARVERKEGVSYFEDMSGADQMALKLKIQQSIAALPGLQYPINASLGKPGGPSVQIQGHLKGITVNVQMPNGKISKMPASNLFLGNNRLVESEPKYLLDPKKKKKIRLGHAESIRRALEEGYDVPPESMVGHVEFGGEE